jgi:hypothetical protein
MKLAPLSRLILFTLALLCAGASGYAATPLREYAAKLKDAQLALESLRQDESGIPAEEDARAAHIVNYARRQLPAEETVQTPNGALQVNNQWLSDALDAYEELERGSREANDQLAAIAGRLSALRDRLEEKNAAGQGSKDEQKGKLENILRRPEYNTQPHDNAMQRLYRRIQEWLASIWPKRAVPLSDEQAKRVSPFAQLLVYGLVALAVGFGLWRVWPLLNRRRLSRRSRKIKAKPRIVLGEKLAPEQTGAGLFAEAEEMARRGDLRAAIRQGYIALLCELSDRKAVRLEQHKTNRDYLREVAGAPALHQPLSRLTNSFEYHWYGLAPANQRDWEEFRQVCQGALK